MGLAELNDLRIDRVSVVDQVCARLLELILDNELGGGEPISEDGVRLKLGVSRVTARSAIAELINAGVLEKEPNHPARVKVMTATDVRDLFDARRPIEIEALKLLCDPRKKGELLSEVEKSIVALDASGGESDATRIGHNIDFHKYIVYSTQNDWLIRSYNALEGGLKLALAQSDVHPSPAETAEEHRRLLDVLVRGDFQEAKEAFLQHVDTIKDEVAESI